MESVSTVYTIVESGGGGGGASGGGVAAARANTPHAMTMGMRCGAEALGDGRKRFAQYVRRGEEECDGDDGGGERLEIVSNRVSGCCLLVPAAFPVGRRSTIHARFTGINATQVRIAAYQRTHLVSEQDLTSDEIQAGTVKVEMPALDEGTVNFVMIADGRVVYLVPCCVLPPAAAADVNGLLEAMVEAIKDSDAVRAEFGSDERSLFQWVWSDSFVSFLTDVNLLFDWLSHGQGPVSMIMDVFMNMLRQCCHYEAWEFGAYMLNKASSCGVTIVSSSSSKTMNNAPLTAQSLKAALCSDTDDETTSTTTQCLHQISSENEGCQGTDETTTTTSAVCSEEGEELTYVCDRSPTMSAASVINATNDSDSAKN